jgi:hypothetical protein
VTKNSYLAGIVMASYVLMFSAAAGATRWANQSGTNCVKHNHDSFSNQINVYYQGNEGIGNFGASSSSSTLDVVCPVDFTTTTSAGMSSTLTYAYYHDRSTLDFVSCVLVGKDYQYDEYIGATRFSCSTTGGCSTGAGYAHMTQSLGFPDNMYLSLTPPMFHWFWSYNLFCKLPYSTENGISFIQGYSTVYDETQ